MITLLFSINLQFGLYLLGALVTLAIGWLHLDSWIKAKKSLFVIFISLGYFFISLSLLGKASQTTDDVLLIATNIFSILGLTLIATGLITEPTPKQPSKNHNHKKHLVLIPPMFISWFFIPSEIILFLLVTFLYWFRVTKVLQKQLKLAAVGFSILSLASILNVQQILFEFTSNPQVLYLFADYGPVWYIQKFVFTLGMVTLAAWAWSYLNFRFKSQIFISSIATIFTIFLVITSGFTWLLLNNLEANVLENLQTNIKVFQYALEKTQLEQLAINKSISVNKTLAENLQKTNTENLNETISKLMVENDASFVHIINPDGVIILRAEDSERKGDSTNSNPLIQMALDGTSHSSIGVDYSLASPQILITAASPIYSEDNKLLGVVSSGYNIDNAFVDGIKSVTGLESTIFANSQRIATTLTAEDGVTRYLNTQESNQKIIDNVIRNGKLYLGKSSRLNRQYYVAYVPIKDLKNETIGMISVGKIQTSLEELIADSIRSTFNISIGLIIVLMFPIYLFSKKIESYLNT